MRRVPRLYHDDEHSAYLVNGGAAPDYVYGGVIFYNNVFHHAFKAPWLYGFPWSPSRTIGDAISLLTGNRVVLYGRPNPQWTCRPAFTNGRVTYYYARDIVALDFPRQRCCECNRKIHPKSPYVLEATTRSLLYKFASRCTKKCDRFTGSPRFARLTDRERDRYWEHIYATVCSPECHEAVAFRYRRTTLDLMETRQWIRQGKELLNDVMAQLPARDRRRKAWRSRKMESNHPETSATSWVPS